MKTNRPDELILVIHGVGDPNPGETIDNFSRALVSEKEGAIEKPERLWLREVDVPAATGDDRYTKTFVSHVRHFEYENHRATAAEIFWGDLSQVRRSIFGVFAGIWQIIFGLRYVAFVGADQPGLGAKFLRILGLHSARVLHGPVLAINFILALLTLILVGTEQLWPKSYLVEMWADVLVISTSVCLLLLAASAWKNTRNRVIERFWFWVFIGSIFLGMLVGVKSFGALENNHLASHPHDELNCGLFWYSRIFFVMLEMQYMWMAVVLFLMTGSWVLALCHPKTNRQGLHVGFLIPILLVGLWSLILPMVWVSGGSALKNLVDPERYEWLFHEAVPLLSIQILATVLLSSVTVSVLIWYAVWRTRNRVESFERGRRSPRLILNPILQFFVGICALLGLGVSLVMAWLQLDGSPYERFMLGRFLVEANRYAMGVLVPLTGMILLSVRYLHPVLDIVLDVVNHFYMRPAGQSDGRAMRDDDEFEWMNVSNGSGNIEYPVRKLIVGRVKKVLEHFSKNIEGKPVLNIISHSQGTVIAVEALNDEELGWVKERFSRINLVTMGSPLGHLYQYYFPHLYPPVDAPFWSNLRSRVERWINIFRIDDYVGTDIPFSESIQASIGPECTNHPVHVAGHGQYWLDKYVLNIIGDAEISPSISEVYREVQEFEENQSPVDEVVDWPGQDEEDFRRFAA